MDKWIKWLLPLLLFSCDGLIETVNNLPDGYARVTIHNYSDIPTTVALDADLNGAGSDVGTTNDEVVFLAGFTSKFFDIKIGGEEKTIYLKIPADTRPAREISLKAGDVKEFTTRLESIYKKRIRLNLYNYQNTPGRIKIKPTTGGASFINNNGEKNYLNSEIFIGELAEVQLKGAFEDGSGIVPSITSIDLIISGTESKFEFSPVSIEDFGNGKDTLLSPSKKSRDREFSLGSDSPREYNYYSKMACVFGFELDIGAATGSSRNYDRIKYTLSPQEGGGTSYSNSFTIPATAFFRYRPIVTFETYIPTESFAYVMKIEKYNGNSPQPIAPAVSSQATCKPFETDEVIYTFDGNSFQ